MSKITWFNKPKIITYIPNDKYVLFIDESGTNSKKVFENSIKNDNKGQNLRDDVYILNGIIMEGKEHSIITKRFNRIKKKITEDGTFDYIGKGERPINFHNVEIDGHKRPFNNLYSDFNEDISNAISKTKFMQLSGGINYYIYCNKKHYFDFDAMLMTLGIIVTNYANFLNNINREGIIIFETSTEIEDNKKLSYIKIKRKGTKSNSNDFFSKITAVYFRPKWANIKGEWKACAGLELADLTLSPLRRFYHPEFINIESKLYEFPNYGRNSINIIKK